MDCAGTPACRAVPLAGRSQAPKALQPIPPLSKYKIFYVTWQHSDEYM
jgi:hypothetical protein